ncbi:hypothetical protein [Paenibacillus sp. GP183]|uniref:hypothetical protein n=1 Tax=Paenibacillus sp. GP183 TaxID=1882751 RepID=UPI00089D0896|nr:hypothetical protein [Paenibacillus sp. GP183]SEB51396.1 hypothetical protein SAMN05443246_0804 [Paenibacillus sp. GP183]
MSKYLRKMLMLNVMSSMISIYIGIFVNLYIWEKNHKVAEVAFYNLVMFVCWGLAFYIGAKLLTRFTIRLPLCLSAISGGAAFTYLMTVQLENRYLWIVLLGIPVGLMFGLFQSIQNLGISLNGKEGEFSAYFAAVNVISQALSIAVPFIAAKAIDWFGYGSTFVLMLLFLLALLVYSFFMPKISLVSAMKELRQEPVLPPMLSFRLGFSFSGAGWMLLSLLAAGIFMQFQNLFTLLFTFSVTQNKLHIAMLNLLYTMSALLGLWLYRRFKINEDYWLWIGTALLALGFLIAIIPVPLTMVFSNVLTSVGMFYFGTVWNSQQFRAIQHFKKAEQASFLVWREITLVATRCVMLSMTFVLKDLRGAWFLFLIAVTVGCLLSIPLFQRLAIRSGQIKMNTF